MRSSVKNLKFIFFLIVIIILAAAGTSFAFRCGSSIIREGARIHEVLQKCGKPDYVDSWEEERISKDYPPARELEPKTFSYRRHRKPVLVKEYVTIDIWTYNLGRNRFIRYLTFENGILTEITIGERGY